MNEDEFISEFHIKLHDISNTSFSLSENMFEKNLSRKILITFPKRIDMKLIVIEEDRDLSIIKVDEFIGSL